MKETGMHLLLLASLALTACGQESTPAQTKPRRMSIGNFLRKAAAEGLNEDAADRAWVKERILGQDAIRNGFGQYGYAEPKDAPLAPAEGKGVPKDIVDDLKN